MSANPFDFQPFDLGAPAGPGQDHDLETAVTLPRPLKHERKEAKRLFTNGLKKQALTELIPTLPPPNTDVYLIGNGAGAEVRHGINPLAFDFGTFIPYLVDMLGGRDCIGYVSSWTMNANHAKSMIELLATGAIRELTVFTDPYFQRREPAVAAQLITGMQAYPDRARYLAFKNHVKAIALAGPDGRTVVITGSANLSAQPRCEQYILTTAAEVYRWITAEFFEEMLTHARANERR